MARMHTDNTAVVGCKLPNGLVLRLHEKMERPQNIPGLGVVLEAGFHPAPQRGEYEVRGTALAKGQRPDFVLSRGAALTRVPKEFAEKWFEQNAGLDAVKNRMIFMVASGSEEDARAQAQEYADERSNQGPIKPLGDPRIPKGKYAVKPQTDKDDE